jgi:hypothetical protein
MSDTRPARRAGPPPLPFRRTGNECFLCGRRESGAWHYAASLGRFVCEECYRRAMTTPPVPAPGRR